jgi:hypothetical protein
LMEKQFSVTRGASKSKFLSFLSWRDNGYGIC